MEDLSYKENQKYQTSDGTVENMLVEEYYTAFRSFTNNRIVGRVFFAAMACFQAVLSSNIQQFCIVITGGLFSLFWLLHEYSVRSTISSLGKLMVNTVEAHDEQVWVNTYINWRRVQWEGSKVRFVQGLEALAWFLLILLISILS